MNNQATSESRSANNAHAQPVSNVPSAKQTKQIDPAAPVAKDEPSTTKNVMNWLQTTQGVFAGIVALLVVLSSLINGMLDLYVTMFNIPRTISEQYNQELFQQHFQKQPIHTGSSVIKTREGAELAIKLSVYENGDIYVEYGNYSQWFPFKSGDKNSSALDWLITPAYAEEMQQGSPCKNQADTPKTPAQSASFGPMSYYTQTDTPLNKRTFRRIRLYDDGCQEELVIDINSGAILQRSLKQKELPAEEKQAMRKKAVQLFSPQVIDIKKIQERPVIDLNSLTTPQTANEDTANKTLTMEPEETANAATEQRNETEDDGQQTDKQQTDATPLAPEGTPAAEQPVTAEEEKL